MDFSIQDLNQSVEFENRIKMTCSFNHAKCSFKQGRIITIKNTNISLIEPHRVEVAIKGQKLLLLYFDKDNMFLYNRTMPIDIKKLEELLKAVKQYFKEKI